MADYRIEIVKDGIDWIIAVAPLIGLSVTVYIAVLQHELSKRNTEIDEKNLKFNVYHERKKVYDAVKRPLIEALRSANVSSQAYSQFVGETRDAEFLFGEEIKNEIEKIRLKIINLQKTERLLSERSLIPVGEERNRLAEENSQLLIWLTDEFDVISRLFAKYLTID